MKKLFMLVIIVVVLSLSGCDRVPIEDGVVAVVYDDIRYEGDSIVIDIWITNGTNEDYYMSYAEFWLEFPDNDTEIAGASFDIEETIKENNYISFEIEITSEYVWFTESDLEDLGYTVDELSFFYYYE